MDYIKNYFLFTEIFAICLSFAIAAIFSENPSNRKESFRLTIKIFITLFFIFSVILNLLTFLGYTTDKKEKIYTHSLTMKEPYCFKCVDVKLPDNFFDKCSFQGDIYIYQGFRKYSIVNKNKYFQYILLHNKKSFIIKDNRYFIPIFNFNLLRNNPVIINRDKKVISIPSDVLNDNKDLNLTDSIKPLYETACNFTPPKN